MSATSARPLPLEYDIQIVIDCLINGQKGLRKIGEALQDTTLKQYFLDESQARAELRANLESIPRRDRVYFDDCGSICSTLNPVWKTPNAKIGGADQSLLAIAEHDQLDATRAYSQVLDQHLPFPVRQTLLAQAARIELFHEYLHAVRKMNRALAGN